MSQTYSPSSTSTSRVPLILTLVWAIMTVAALVFVATFGANAPYTDEWDFVPALLGKEPLSTWLWSQHNEHRLPLSRAIYYVLFQVTHDFRTGMFLQVAMLSALAFGLMRVAARLRGRPEWVDLFFPVSLLHLAHWENFLMGYQICFALFCCLVTCLGVVAMKANRESAFRSGLLAGILLQLIVLTGGFGLAVFPPVSLWLVYLALIVWRSGSRLRAVLILALAVLPLAYMAFYFDGYQRPGHHEAPSRNPIAIGIVAAEVLAMAIGYGAVHVWWLVAIVELVIGVCTLLWLIGQSREAFHRPASTGLIAVAAGVCGLAVAIGIGRGSMGTEMDMGLWPRYSLLVWPILGIMFLVWVKAGRKWVPIFMCVASAVFFTPNLFFGLGEGLANRMHYNQIENDLQAGLSVEQIVQKDFPKSRNESQMDRAIRHIPLLRSAGIGVFGAGKR
jgi:hypothetical protein